ncbi:MAG: hypothetical protein HS111_24650 [Kofleriaceae bacterium]|nr:hypothetical protein [Kofleriaceae bacterium]
MARVRAPPAVVVVVGGVAVAAVVVVAGSSPGRPRRPGLGRGGAGQALGQLGRARPRRRRHRQGGGQGRAELAEVGRDRVGRDHRPVRLRDQLRHRRVAARLVAGGGLVQGRGQAVDVGGGGELAQGQRLGRGVGRRAQELTRQRGLGVGDVGDAEVGQLPQAAGPAQHVGRLDVAVDDAAGVGGLERSRELDPERAHLGGGQRAALGDHRAQGRPLDQLQHQVGLAVLDPQVEDLDHAGVGEGGQGAGLGLEAGVEARRHHAQQVLDPLDRDVAPQPLVVGAQDLAHRAGAERADHAVATDPARGGLHPSRISRPRGAWHPRAAWVATAPGVRRRRRRCATATAASAVGWSSLRPATASSVAPAWSRRWRACVS